MVEGVKQVLTPAVSRLQLWVAVAAEILQLTYYLFTLRA